MQTNFSLDVVYISKSIDPKLLKETEMVRHHIKKAANSLTNYSKKTANLIGSKLYYALALLAWPGMEFMIKHKIFVPDPYRENNPSDPYANLKALEKEVKKDPHLLNSPKGPAVVGESLKYRNSLGHIDFRKFAVKCKDYLRKWAEMAVLVQGDDAAKEILQVEKEIDEIIAADEAQKVE